MFLSGLQNYRENLLENTAQFYGRARYSLSRLYSVLTLIPRTCAAFFLSPPSWSRVARIRRRSASASEAPTRRCRLGWADEFSEAAPSWGSRQPGSIS